MRPVDDIRVDQAFLESADLAEQVGVRAVESLERLWAPRGFHANNRKVDLGEPLSEDGTEDGAGQGTPDELGESSSESIPAGAFNLATIVSLGAILDILIAAPDWLRVQQRQRAITSWLAILVTQDPTEADPLHPNDEAHPCLRLLRYGLTIESLAKLSAWQPKKSELRSEEGDADAANEGKVVETMLPTVRALLKELEILQEAARSAIGKHVTGLVALVARFSEEELAALHPFVVYRVVCALEAVERLTEVADEIVETSATTRAALWHAHKPRLRELVAQHSLNSLDAGASIGLLFGAATAARMAESDYVEALLKCVEDDARVPAIWSQGRILAQDSENLAVVEFSFPSLEAPRALAEIVLNSLEDKLASPMIRDRGRVTSLLLDLLRNTHADHIDETEGGFSGWAGDRIYRDHVIEAWPTASALGYSVAVAEIIDRVQRSRILDEFHAIESWGADWPVWLRWSEYLKNEPEKDAGILRFIDEKVVAPRRKLGSSARAGAVVVLLFGPPGTTKTTIARSVANGLGWPIVPLSPGDFIDDGLDKVEKRATWVFQRLQQLSRTVVILDECDELFRKRDPDPATEPVRQVSAFITASMLPKLQDLHDRSRVVVFLCTNFLTSIDNAIKRPGRVDHLIAVSPPDDEQRERVINEELDLDPSSRANLDTSLIDAGVTALVASTEGLTRGELVNVARRLGTALSTRHSWTEREIRNAAKAIAKPATNPRRMAIDPSDKRYKEFEEDRQVISEPHRNGSA